MESVPADGRCLPSQQPKPFEGRHDLLSDMGPMVAPLGSSVSTLESRMSLADKGRMAWQRDSGYHQRAGVEGQFARWKRVIGDGLRFRSDEARATEVAIAAQVLNRMLDLGRPNSVRVA